jgi:hypothetical protein
MNLFLEGLLILAGGAMQGSFTIPQAIQGGLGYRVGIYSVVAMLVFPDHCDGDRSARSHGVLNVGLAPSSDPLVRRRMGWVRSPGWVARVGFTGV